MEHWGEKLPVAISMGQKPSGQKCNYFDGAETHGAEMQKFRRGRNLTRLNPNHKLLRDLSSVSTDQLVILAVENEGLFAYA